MPRKPGASVRVRGTCREGHVTEATSAPGRVTWEGSCSHEGCDLPVKARRMPGRVAAPVDSGTPGQGSPPASPTPETPPAKPAGRLRRVRYDIQPDQLPREPDPEPEQPAGGDAGGGGAAAPARPVPVVRSARHKPVPGGDDADAGPGLGQRPTVRQRLAARRSARAERGT